VVEVQYQGHDSLARVRLSEREEQDLLARIPGELELEAGQRVWIEVIGVGRAWPNGAGRPTTDRSY
jgi:hypothetical protein